MRPAVADRPRAQTAPHATALHNSHFCRTERKLVAQTPPSQLEKQLSNVFLWDCRGTCATLSAQCAMPRDSPLRSAARNLVARAPPSQLEKQLSNVFRRDCRGRPRNSLPGNTARVQSSEKRKGTCSAMGVVRVVCLRYPLRTRPGTRSEYDTETASVIIC